MPRTITHQIDYECTPTCRSKHHTYDLNCAITKGTLPEIQAYFSLCYRNGRGKDIWGRTALHVASSCGKLDVIQWLLTKNHADVRARDRESGWTALHRAVFYRQLSCARVLLQAGSSLTVRDNEGLTPLDLLRRDGDAYMSLSNNDPNDVYSWGDNSNFTLGHTIDKGRPLPEMVDAVHNIKQIVMNKYHTVLLSQSGHVYTCGHGLGGRLGSGDRHTCLIPKLVKLGGSEVVCEIAAAVDHTLLLTERGNVYSFGVNSHHQLGHLTSDKQVLTPKKIMGQSWGKEKITHVVTSPYHTLLCSASAVYSFGLNAGQLGHIRGDKYQINARQISAIDYTTNPPLGVCVSDCASLIQSTLGNVYLLQGYTCRKIITKRADIVKIRVQGGHLDTSVDPLLFKDHVETDLRIIMLSSTGWVYIWRQGYTSPHICTWLIQRELLIHDLDLSLTSMTLVTFDGCVFVGHFTNKKQPELPISPRQSSDKKRRHPDFNLAPESEDIHVDGVSLVCRATAVAMDYKGANYMVVQSNPAMCLTDIPVVSEPKLSADFKSFLADSDSCDGICDVILKVGNQSFPTHKYILSTRSEYLHKLIVESQKRHVSPFDQTRLPTIHIHHIEADVFEQILRFIYTNDCEWLNIGKIIEFNASSQNLPQNLSQNLPQNLHDYSNNNAFDKKSHNCTTKENTTNISNKRVSVAKSDTKTMSFNEREEHRKWKRRKSKVEEIQTESETSLALKSLRQSAVRFGLTGLVDRICSLTVENNRVTSTEYTRTNMTQFSFQRNKFREFCDVTIKCEEGQSRKCHSCVLVGRVEYFRCMLAADWIESQGKRTVSLPLPVYVVDVLLDFIYTGTSPIFTDHPPIELVCNVLVVADQLLITRLKEMCESALTDILSLKNACELLEFASMYQAAQLIDSSSQFISHNLAVLVESRSLDVLSDSVMDGFTTYYRTHSPNSDRRLITPYTDGPDPSYLTEHAEKHTDVSTNIAPNEKRKLKKKRRSRSKSIGEITSLIKLETDSCKIEGDVLNDGSKVDGESFCGKVLGENVKDLDENTNLKQISHRLHEKKGRGGKNDFGTDMSGARESGGCIENMGHGGKNYSFGKDMSGATRESDGCNENMDHGGKMSGVHMNDSGIVKNVDAEMEDVGENGDESFELGEGVDVAMTIEKQAPLIPTFSHICLWPAGNRNNSNQGDDLQTQPGSAPTPHLNLRDIMAEEKKHAKISPDTPESPKRSKHSSVLKHKHWKPLTEDIVSPQKEAIIPEVTEEIGASVESKPTENPWSSVSSLTLSFKDLMKEEQKLDKRRRKSSENNTRVASPDIAVPETPEKVQTPAWTVGKSEKAGLSFCDIVQDERVKTDILNKNRTRPLHLIQIEEKAIEELLLYYGAEKRLDDRITVERVPSVAVTPVWTRHK